MAIQDTQKVDFLLKKVGYEIGKTAPATSKTPDNETKASPIIVSSENLWLDPIPENSATASEATSKTFTILTFDPTSEINNKKVTWLAPNRDWISNSYGNYGISVYVADANPVATTVNALQNSTPIQPAGTNNDGYFIDYAAGIIHFADTNIPSVLTEDKALYIEGYRYVGKKGSEGIALKTLDLTQFANTSASGLRSIITETTGSGALVFQSSPTFNNGVTINGDLIVTGTGVAFSAATLVVTSLTAFSGNFTNALTVSGIPVSLNGHGHSWEDISVVGTDFCDDVGDCVNTELIGSSGVQLIYTSDNTLRVALSGESLAQHLLSDTGFVARSGLETYVTRTISGGSNIAVNNGDGLLGNPTVSLSGTVTGLTAVTATTFTGSLQGNATTATTLETARTIGGVSFNGSASIDLPGVNTNGNQDTTGNAATSDKVKTISSVSDQEQFLTFVDSNNVPAIAESVFTGSIKYTPATDTLVVGGATINNNLVVGGDLTVNGTTVTANVDNMVVEDPIITLGKPSGTIASENKDRGIEFVYPSGAPTVAATGFFGFDKSATEFIAARDVTINNEIVTVNSYLDARFKDINGSVITASSQFSGPGSGLTGTASSLTAGKATNLDGGAIGEIPYQTASGTTTFLNLGTSGQFLRVNDGVNAPYWDTVDYAEIGNLPTIGDETLTFSVSGSGLTIGTDTTFTANSTTAKTFSIDSNATPANFGNTIVSRDSVGSFSANIITASLQGNATTATTATNANHIEVDPSTFGTHQLVFVSGINGNLKPLVNTNLRFDAANNILLGDDVTTPTTKIEYFIIDGGTP